MLPEPNAATHFIRVHIPFSVPKQWVRGAVVRANELSFTDNQSECGKYTMADAIAIIDDMHQKFPSLIIAMDAI